MRSKKHLDPMLIKDLRDFEEDGLRDGFGRGLLRAGKANEAVVALCADLTESTRMNLFAEKFPDRFVQVGVAEQNLVTVASGMAAMGKVPFTSSYAAFSPGRNWEQIRTTICLNEANVKIVGSHAGVSVGPDGATHQMLEDIALMRVLPNMMVLAPCDGLEAEKATIAAATYQGPVYIRLARASSPVFTTEETPFSLEKAQIFREGSDVTVVACGILVYEALLAAEELKKQKIEVEVINCPVIKPLDVQTILESTHKTGAVVTAEEAQINGGLGGAVAEVLSENLPVPFERIGMEDRFGESGEPAELLEHFGLTSEHIKEAVLAVIERKG
ncbi:MAG: transketolase family protein [Candidatus Saccharimonadales bacterium]